MARRKRLTDQELKLFDTTVTDEEAFKQFNRNCLIRNLRPATIKYYKNELLAVKASLEELDIEKDIVQLTQKDIEALILHLKENIKVVSINKFEQ